MEDKRVKLTELEHLGDAKDAQDVEKRLLCKLDLHLVPILFVLFLFAFIDRFVVALEILFPRFLLTLLRQNKYWERSYTRAGGRSRYERIGLQHCTVYLLHPVYFA